MTVLSLKEAQKTIIRQLSILKEEEVLLGAAAGRIAASAITAGSDVPAFSRSAMDGYAVNSLDLDTETSTGSFAVAGEIAAGTTDIPRLPRKSVIKIMTGGAIPHGADQIIPFELCRAKNDQVLIDSLPRPGAFIRARGVDLKKEQTIVRAGHTIEAQHLPLLAESGLAKMPVVARPRVAIICTGSELLSPLATPEKGQIISGNRFLLDALCKISGAIPLDLGLVRDNLDSIVARLAEALDGPADAVLTTGGMGPGKYDLLPQAFARLGIKPCYQALSVRPGRSTMFGMHRQKPVFALPGPPPAVFLLFNELVRPGLRKLQGFATPLPPLQKAVLTETISLNKRGMLNLKGGVTSQSGTTLTIRPAKNLEPASAIIHIPANRSVLPQGATITFRPLL